MSEWKKVRLGDVSKGGRGYYGIGASAVPFNPEKYTYLRITDINDDGTLNKIDLKSVDAENAADYLLSPNDVVFARTGNSTGRNYFYDGKDGKFVYAGFLIKFSIDNEKINPKYVKYFLQTKEYWDWISSFNTGSTRGNINAQTYANLEIPLLSPKLQNLIAEVLGALDDKIELNNRINRNLEEQAQALFKRWFVDFEFPDANGNPYRSSGGEMTDSPLGSIPKGWEVGTLADIGEIIGGGTPSKAKDEYYTNNCIAWITPKDLSINKSKFIGRGENDITEFGYKNSSAKLMPRGSVLFSSRAPIGYIAIAKNEVCTNQGFKSIIPKANIGAPFIYYFLKENIDLIESKASGSTFKEASGGLMKSLDVAIPENKTLKLFNEICNSCFKEQENIENENQTLAKLRDSLLPKLMNNQIKIQL